MPGTLALPRWSCAAILLLAAACQQDRGEVELNWTIVDRAGGQVFPSGALEDTCSFAGFFPGRDGAIDYAVNVEVRMCEPGCAAGCGDPACLADSLVFACDAARGYATVEARDLPFDFAVQLVANPADGGCGCAIQSPCALVPGPRRRTVEPGLITDLQVYLMVLGFDDVDAARADGRVRLDLAPDPTVVTAAEACCVPDAGCTAPGT